MIVIDVGCAKHGSEDSIPILLERFKPSMLYGFDPLLDPAQHEAQIGKTRLLFFRAAAWVYDGEIGFAPSGSRSHIDVEAPPCVCIDLAKFIERRDEQEAMVLKIDAEGSEYLLLQHLHKHDLDKRLSRVWVEWHPNPYDPARALEQDLKTRLRCEVEDWHY